MQRSVTKMPKITGKGDLMMKTQCLTSEETERILADFNKKQEVQP